MGFFNWFNKREETPDITPPVSDVLLEALLKDEVITREKAMTLPAVSGAVDFICNCVASMPVKLYKYKQGKVEEQENDSRIKLLNGDTGDTLNAFQMKKAMVEDYLMGKGGYCYIQRNRNEITGLFYVEDIYVTVLKNFKPIFKDYVILVEGNQYKPYEFLKLLRNTKDGASGVGLTVEVSKALETAYQTLLYQLGLVKSGGNKKGFLKSQRKLGQSEIDTLKAAWKRMYANDSESVVVLNNGLEFQEASNSSVEMQLNENKNTLTGEINNIFHIHPDDFELTFKFAIYPIIKAFETALNRDLLLEKEKKNMFFEFDVKEIIKASFMDRYQAYKLAKETGFMTLNEIRKAENMNYIEGLDVVNVGLGAVLYDTNTHTYYTPNTDTVGDPNDGSSGDEMDKMLENHELAEAYDESGNSAERILERYNDVHDKDGRFGTKSGSKSSSSSGGSKKDKEESDNSSNGSSSKGSESGSGGSGGGSGKLSDEEKQAKIAELEEELANAKGIFAKAKIHTEIEMLQNDWQGTKEEWQAFKKKKHEEAVKKSNEEYAKKQAEYEKQMAEKKQKQYEEYDKFKDDKIESKTSSEKVKDLKAERENYDSDAEFEQSFTKLYHGGSKESVNGISKNVEVLSVNEKEEKYGDMSGGNIYGLSTATVQKSAEVFSESRGNKKVAELYMSKDAKVYDLKDKHIDDMTYKEVNDLLKQGYDAINVGGDENEMRILNPNVVYTKKQIESAKKRSLEQRYNDSHDAKTGRFAPKSGGGSASSAGSSENGENNDVGKKLAQNAENQSWDDFYKNVKDKEMRQYMVKNGINSPAKMKDYWAKAKMKSFTEKDAHEMSKEDAIETIRENISDSTMKGWFVNADSDYKDRLQTSILENKDVRNAGLNIAYHNYKEMTGSDIGFKEFINKEIPMFRGEHGQKTVEQDVFKSFTTDRKVAESFGSDVSEIKIKPIDTLGSFQTTAEAEYLVPIDKIKD